MNNHHPIWFVRSFGELFELIKCYLLTYYLLLPLGLAIVFGIYSETNWLGVIGNGIGLSIEDTRENLKPAARQALESTGADAANIKERKVLRPTP